MQPQYGRSYLTVWELRQVYMHAEGKKDDFVCDLWNAEQSDDVLIQDGKIYLSNIARHENAASIE